MKKVLFLTIVIFITIRCSLWYEYSGVIRYPKYIVGTHVRDVLYRQGGGRSSVFVYKVNGVNYETWGPSFPIGDDYGIGDSYLVKYDSLYPWWGEVILEEPVFLADQKIKKTEGIVTTLSNRFCCYKFSDVFDYKKLQKIYKGTLQKYPYLKVGAKFEVEYNAENPYHSKINFDKPIIDTTNPTR